MAESAIGYLESKEDCKIINLQTLKTLNQKKEDLMKLKYGNGTITKRTRKNSNGSNYYWYQARYYDKYGNQKTITAKTQQEVLVKLKEAIKQEKKIKKSKNRTLQDWLQEYYEIYKKPFIKESTQQSYETCIKLHISEGLKKTKLNEVTVTQVQEAINKIDKPRQKKITALLLKSALQTAYENDYINIKGWNNIKTPNPERKEKNILSYEDQPKLLAILDKQMQNIVLAYLFTGCRLNELLTITEQDIDRKNKLITIKGTKSKTSYRTIPLLPEAENLLPIGSNISARTIQVKFKKAVTQLNLKITIHDLRHTFATRCLEKGVNMKTVQVWLGHSTYSITADIYSHITKQFQESEVDKLK